MSCVRPDDHRRVLVHGLFADPRARPPGSGLGARREAALDAHGETLGLLAYEWVDGRARKVANRLSRLVRGTAEAVDAVELVEFDTDRVRAAIGDPSAADRLGVLACAPDGFDRERSFVLVGAPILQLEGPRSGQRVLWFGVGAAHLDEADFVEHYTTGHGPLVAGHAALIGLRSYRQVPDDDRALAAVFREQGLGRADAPAVFAEMYMGRPPLGRGRLRAQRVAQREIRVDEQRHIDFARSMLLLA